jgi:hypothetical protein
MAIVLHLHRRGRAIGSSSRSRSSFEKSLI